VKGIPTRRGVQVSHGGGGSGEDLCKDGGRGLVLQVVQHLHRWQWGGRGSELGNGGFRVQDLGFKV